MEVELHELPELGERVVEEESEVEGGILLAWFASR